MSVHIHEVNESRNRTFLSEGRKDPFTKEKIKAGDRIVFCAGCKSAFLHSSWEAIRGRHCDQTETLADFPYTPRLGDVTKLQQTIQVLTNESTSQQGKIKVLATLCCLFTGLIAVIGYFVYDQHQRINKLQSLNLGKGSQILNLEQQGEQVKQKISTLNNNLTSDNCRNDSSQTKNLEEQVTSFETKVDCFVREHENLINERDSYKKERDSYKNTLNGYPYSLPLGSEVNYRGELSTSNQESNPILYRLYVPDQSRFDIYLQNMEADGDFEILDSNGNRVENSRSTNTGSDELRNFNLSSGTYNIKIWNHSSDISTYFILRVYRQIDQTAG